MNGPLGTRRELFSVVFSSWAISQQVDLKTGKINSELRNEKNLVWYFWPSGLCVISFDRDFHTPRTIIYHSLYPH